MNFLKKIFGNKAPIDEMRLCHSRQEWAGVLLAGKKVERETLDQDQLDEVLVMETAAGDALATINIDEGIWSHKSGNLLRAREDFQLAVEQACSETVKNRARQTLAALDNGEMPTDDEPAVGDDAGHAGCHSCSPTRTEDENAGADLDEEVRMELLLAAMDPDLANRYLAAGNGFRKAWLETQEGDENKALNLFNDILPDQRDVLFLFERGALLARSGQAGKARQDLLAALTIEPDFFPAFETLIETLFNNKRVREIETLLKQSIAEERFTPYCWSRLAELEAKKGKLEAALVAGLKAVDEGASDPNLLVLCSQLLERENRLDEAEEMLKKLPAGGCGGGTHPMLAEFWLRHKLNLSQALESFKGALRQEKNNPRWLLRVAQVYMEKGWRKEATSQVERLMGDDNLPDVLKQEVNDLADQLKKS